MNKIILIALIIGVTISSATAMNLGTGYNIFSDIIVNKGFCGQYFSGINPLSINWGTTDNITYELKVNIEGTGERFFYGYKNATISNTKSYEYFLKLCVPNRTKIGSYPFQICGTICDGGYPFQICYSGCTKQFNVIVKKMLKRY